LRGGEKVKMKMKVLTSLMLLSFLVVALASVPAQAQAATPTVTKTVNPTNVYVAGSGGSPEWFEVKIEVDGFGGETTQTDVPIDVVFAIDSSGSMGWNDPSDLRLTAAKAFVEMMGDVHQAGVVSWDDNLDFTLALTYTTDAGGKTTVKDKIDTIDSSGGTNLNVGLNAAIAVLDANTRGSSSVEVIVFLSDGEGTYTDASSGGPAADAASKGYTVYTIGLNMEEAGIDAELALQDIATATGGTYYSSPEADNLEAIFDEIFTSVIISTAPQDVDVHEITQDYIIDESSFSITPTSITTNPDGTTYLFWEDVGDNTAVGDGADPLTSSETFTVTFMAKCNIVGTNLPVDQEQNGEAYPIPSVTYIDPAGSAQSVPIPQAYINVVESVVAGESIVLAPQEAVNIVCTQHTVTATVTDAAGAPAAGQVVTFTILTGPHAETTCQATTDDNGEASFTYTGTCLGTDTIQASFVNGQGQTVTSNEVTKTWTPIDQVIPEVPLGTVVGLGSMILAVSLYFAIPKIRGKKPSL
jgi:Ca-activated chloride channel family protein